MFVAVSDLALIDLFWLFAFPPFCVFLLDVSVWILSLWAYVFPLTFFAVSNQETNNVLFVMYAQKHNWKFRKKYVNLHRYLPVYRK